MNENDVFPENIKRTRRRSQEEKITDNLAQAMANILNIEVEEPTEVEQSAGKTELALKEAEITAKTWAEVIVKEKFKALKLF